MCRDTHHTHYCVPNTSHNNMSRHILLCPDPQHTIMCRDTNYCVPTHITQNNVSRHTLHNNLSRHILLCPNTHNNVSRHILRSTGCLNRCLLHSCRICMELDTENILNLPALLNTVGYAYNHNNKDTVLTVR